MMIKINFKDKNPTITVGDICTFVHNKSLDFFKAKYIGNSRIDAYPIFDILTTSSNPVSEYILNYKSLDFYIDTAELIRPLEDNYKQYNKDYQENMDDLFRLAKDIFNITEDDMLDREKFKSKLRDLKLTQILSNS